MSNLDDLSLKYLVNNQIIEKLNKKNNEINMNKRYNDFKFYKKRIIQIIKELLTNKNYKINEDLPKLPKNINEIWNTFIISLLDFLKEDDKNYILQKEFNKITKEENKEKMKWKKQLYTIMEDDNDEIKTFEQINSIIMNKELQKNINENNGDITNFVKIKKTNTDVKKIDFPREKNVNTKLKSKKLKYRGINKKKIKKDKNIQNKNGTVNENIQNKNGKNI